MEERSIYKVVVVEDEDKIRARLAKILKDSGRYRPLEAADGRAALEVILAESPGFVLLDHSLPVLDGGEVILALEQIIEERPSLQRISVIALTGKGESWKRREISNHALISDYVSKSCDPYRLLLTLDNLAQSRQHQERIAAEQYKKLGIKSLFSAIMDAAQEGFLLTNRQGYVSYANSAAGKIIGVARGQTLYGEHLSSFLGEELAEMLVGSPTAQRIIEDVSRKTVRLSRTRDGRETVIHFTMYPYHGPDGQENGIIFHIRDLEFLRRELERAGVSIGEKAVPLFQTPSGKR